jgi:hypothetical protein
MPGPFFYETGVAEAPTGILSNIKQRLYKLYRREKENRKTGKKAQETKKEKKKIKVSNEAIEDSEIHD